MSMPRGLRRCSHCRATGVQGVGVSAAVQKGVHRAVQMDRRRVRGGICVFLFRGDVLCYIYVSTEF